MIALLPVNLQRKNAMQTVNHIWRIVAVVQTVGPPPSSPSATITPQVRNFCRIQQKFQNETDPIRIGNVAGEYNAVKAPLGHGVVQMTDEGLTGPGV